MKAFLGAGLLGSFTTYSAFAVSLVALASRSEWALAAGYLAATVVLGLAGALLGLRLGGRTAAPHPAGEPS
jgi:CrcB protein